MDAINDHLSDRFVELVQRAEAATTAAERMEYIRQAKDLLRRAPHPQAPALAKH